ncbi:hypothetical protein J7L81_05640 [Candidatus Aerophobetes bacterium]|nr:hypothetical protein [Candidatus Aerophobetes bacterium]
MYYIREKALSLLKRSLEENIECDAIGYFAEVTRTIGECKNVFDGNPNTGYGAEFKTSMGGVGIVYAIKSFGRYVKLKEVPVIITSDVPGEVIFAGLDENYVPIYTREVTLQVGKRTYIDTPDKEVYAYGVAAVGVIPENKSATIVINNVGYVRKISMALVALGAIFLALLGGVLVARGGKRSYR